MENQTPPLADGTTLNEYDVHAYVTVRIKVTGVQATSQRAAFEQVETQLRPREHCDREIGVDVDGLGHIEYAEYAEEITAFIVDERGDTEYERSERYDLKAGEFVAEGDALAKRFTYSPSPAFLNERPWCGWMVAFAADSDWDTTGFSLEKLMGVNFLLTTTDGRSRPVRMKQWQWIEDRREGEVRAHVPAAGIEVVELDTDSYEPLTPERVERVRYEDIREIVVF